MEGIEHERMAPGSARVSTEADCCVSKVIRENLMGIDPVHWAETEKRIAILNSWCATKRHAAADAVAAAERMGV